MRVRLYGLLVGLAGFTALAVIVGETTDTTCAIICGWQVALAVAGLTAFFAFCGVAVLTILYEIRRAFRRSDSDA